MVKFRKHSSPAFRPGEVWVGSSGVRVVVVKTFKDRWRQTTYRTGM